LDVQAALLTDQVVEMLRQFWLMVLD